MPDLVRVLFVEDSAVDAELMELALRRRFSRIETRRVEEAVGLGAALSERAWDVVLCDWTLPRFSVRAALAMLNERKLDLPVILVSGSIGEETTAEAMRAGARDFVLKSRLERLAEAVQSAIHDGALRAELSRQRDEKERCFEALQRAHDELESRVEQRTLELGIATERLARELAERERTDEALRHAKDAADAANHAKSAFLANMSHEIRTPMNAILGYTQLLARDPVLAPKQQQNLEVIRRSGEHLLSLINDVLEMSKIEAGHRALVRCEVDLWSMVDDLERMFRLRVAEDGPALHVSRSASVPQYILGDEGKLRQVLANLLGNAVKFTAAGAVTARLSTAPGATGAELLVVEVLDTGPGMSPAEVEGLFQPFVQTRVGIQGLGGTGLGLALSREFARLMGGDITVQSQPGKGSTFRVEIPIELGGPPSTARAVRATGRVVGILGSEPPRRTLVVDDDQDNRNWLTQLLTAVGFEVREARNGVEALALCAAWAPALVLMDMNMPVMDGYAATRAIRRLPAPDGLVIVAVTASAFDDAREAIFSAGADGWLRKPCREAELFEEIGHHLGIQYRYGEARVSSASVAPRSRAEVGATLSAELHQALQHALLIADHDRLKELVLSIPPEHAAFADELSRLADRFAYDDIAALLHGVGSA
jgi:signal transduction histidine kinase